MSSPSDGNLSGQRRQQLPQRVRLHFQLGDAGTLARNAKKLNMHDVRSAYQIDSIECARTASMPDLACRHADERASSLVRSRRD